MHEAGFERQVLVGNSDEATTIDTKFICSFCGNVLRNPVQVSCGHRYCRECLEQCLTKETECPTCKLETEDTEIARLDKNFPDNGIRKELHSLKAYCYFDGCTWTGLFKEFEINHYNLCEFKRSQCPICHQSLTRKHPDNKKSEGEEACSESTPPSDHITCVFKRCKIIEEIVGFCDNGNRNVQKPILERIPILEEKIKELRRLLSELKNTNNSTNNNSNSDSNSNSNNNSNNNSNSRPNSKPNTQSLEAADGRSEEYEADRGEIEGAAGGRCTKSGTGKREVEIAEEKMYLLEAALTVMNKELIQLTGEMEAVERRSRSQRETVQTMDAKIKLMERQMALKDASIAELDRKITELEQTSYDGTLLWKISDFNRKRQESVAGRTTSFFSPTFYTSKTGYKMCARIYLNGDGMGKGTHVSLFFVIMRGQYDALLGFPFRHKVTMTLVDQNQRNHVTDTFKPDPTSSSFKRPTTEMNIATGCPVFMPLSHLDSPSNAYVKDNTAFVKITISSDSC